jgi:hypothetical protein
VNAGDRPFENGNSIYWSFQRVYLREKRHTKKKKRGIEKNQYLVAQRNRLRHNRQQQSSKIKSAST